MANWSSARRRPAGRCAGAGAAELDLDERPRIDPAGSARARSTTASTDSRSRPELGGRRRQPLETALPRGLPVRAGVRAARERLHLIRADDRADDPFRGDARFVRPAAAPPILPPPPLAPMPIRMPVARPPQARAAAAGAARPRRASRRASARARTARSGGRARRSARGRPRARAASAASRRRRSARAPPSARGRRGRPSAPGPGRPRCATRRRRRRPRRGGGEEVLVGRATVVAHLLAEAARRPLRADEAVDVVHRQAGARGELGDRRLAPMRRDQRRRASRTHASWRSARSESTTGPDSSATSFCMAWRTHQEA